MKWKNEKYHFKEEIAKLNEALKLKSEKLIDYVNRDRGGYNFANAQDKIICSIATVIDNSTK